MKDFTEKGRMLRVMSSNVRCTTARDGDNHWACRRDMWIQTVRAFDPDLLGLQEVCPDQHEEVTRLLPDYGHAGLPREDGHSIGERALVLYRTERFEPMDTRTFWLSETPEVVGSRSWDAHCTRICTWVRVRDRRSGRTLLFANTHLDHGGKLARREGARLIRQRLADQANGEGVLLTGDFNCREEDEPYRVLLSPNGDGLVLRDSYRIVHPQRRDDEATYHGFTGMTDGGRIDWLLHSPHLHPLEAQIVRTGSPEGRYPSDHYPITAVLQWV